MDRIEPRQASAGGGAHIPRTVAPDPPHRPLRSGGVRIPLGLGLFVAVLLLGALPARAAVPAAAARTTAHNSDSVELVRQSPWVGPSAPDQALSMGLRIQSRAARRDLHLSVTVYSHLTTRSDFDQTLSGRGLGAVVAHSPAIPLSSLSTDAQGVTGLTIPVNGDRPPTVSGDWTADLNCSPGSCADVYPVKVTLGDSSSQAGTGTQLITYLVYDDPAAGAAPLRFALVVPLGIAPPVADTTGRVPTPASGAVSALERLAASFGAGAPVPVTLVPDPATVTELGSIGRDRAPDLVSELSQSPARQVIAQSYVPVDAAALADAGLGGELDAQVQRGATVLAAGPAPVHATRGTWVSATPLDQSALSHLAGQFGHVVVPQDGVSGPTGPLTPTQPFTLTTGKGPSATAMTADPGLGAHLTAAQGRNPVLAAEQLLADLAFVYYEAPNLRGPGGTTAPRALVAVAPEAWTPRAGFLGAVLAGLQGNPVIAPVTLDQLFAQVPVGADRQPTTRHPVDGGGHDVSAAALRTARQRQSDFASAASGDSAGTATVAQLGDLLLAAESSSLPARRQRAAVAGYDAAVGHQLAQLSVRSDTIRLTAGTASVPITVVRNTAYPVTVDLRLTSDKLQFPQAGSQVPGALCQTPVVQSSAGRSTFSALCVLNHTTNAVYVNMRSRTSGDFRIDVTLVSPHGDLVLAGGHLTVRSMSTSAVAIGLSAGAGAVLLLWWGRTVWRGKWGRRGAHARSASGGAPT